jgi:hypothetical protein
MAACSSPPRLGMFSLVGGMSTLQDISEGFNKL